MISVKWVDPNFKFDALDREGHPYQYCCYARDEQTLGDRLQRMNLVVRSVAPYDFQEWRDRAKKATESAIQAHQAGKKPIPFKQALWAELKWHLFELFRGKCAYCESKAAGITGFGDVEHYRPKSKVDEDPGHSGYYWLAYEPTNLMPSCALCNQTRGKMTHFPVAGGTQHARTPDAIDNERPLLLNPYDTDFNVFDHLDFTDGGEALPYHQSPFGEASRMYYHLNRPGLSENRRTVIAHVKQDWLTLAFRLENMIDAYNNLRTELTLGDREYSAAQLCHLERLKQQQLRDLADLPPLRTGADPVNR